MKKLMATLLVVVMLLSCFALTACAKDTSDGVLTIWLYGDDLDYYPDYNSNPVVTLLEDKFEIDIQLQIPAIGSEADNFNLMLGTGDYTDVFNLTYATETTEVLYEDGVIIDLEPYLEKYMPNYLAYLNANPQVKAAITSDDGHIFNILIASPEDKELMWGGLVYRRDILATMTGGYVAFPSGKDVPTTIADWEYMLNLYSMYFGYAGMTDYACLILPYNGYFPGGELLSGFGVGNAGICLNDDGEVIYGATTQEYRNYLSKMAEWYAKGWIYQDFASRTNDMFYLPNTSLTYGAAAGIWYGLAGAQLGDVMSMPEYGLYFDVQPAPSPIDTEHGITAAKSLLAWTNFSMKNGYAISTNCGKKDMIAIMEAFDYLYSDEGSMIVSLGLPEEYAANNEVYKKLGLEKGAWGYNADGSVWISDKCMGENATVGNYEELYGLRLPGEKKIEYQQAYDKEIVKEADDIWTQYGKDWVYPPAVTMNADENVVYAANSQNLNDCVTEYTTKFIMGTLELNDANWAKFQADLKTYKLDEFMSVYKSSYARYMEKMSK